MDFKISENLYLEIVHEKHAAELFQLIDQNREYLKRWMPWASQHLTIQNTLKFIADSRNEIVDKHGFTTVIFFNQQICGVIGFHHVDWLNKKATMGYWLARNCQGKGIMTKACQTLISYYFNELDFHRIMIECGLKNFKSQAIPKRLGFTEEGILRESEFLNGEFIDHFSYSILKHEWQQATPEG